MLFVSLYMARPCHVMSTVCVHCGLELIMNFFYVRIDLGIYLEGHSNYLVNRDSPFRQALNG